MTSYRRDTGRVTSYRRDTGRVTSNRSDTGRVTSKRRELGRTDKGQVREIQNITSRFPTVLLSSLMMF